MNDKRIPYISLLQAFAILCVIVGHVTRVYYSQGAYWHIPAYSSAFFDGLARFLYTFHLPLFVFISGYLAERTLHKNPAIKAFIERRMERLLVPFWGWGLFYSLPIWIMLGLPNGRLDYFFVGLNTGHLWFLPMLFMVTMAYLPLRKLPQKLDFAVLIALICFYFLKKSAMDYFGIYRIPEFLLYYYLGAKFFITENFEFCNNSKVRMWLTAIAFLVFFSAEYLAFGYNYRPMWVELTIGVSGVTFLVFFAKIIAEHYGEFIERDWGVQFLSLNLLTVYVLHEPLMEIILKYLDWGNAYPPAPTCLILFVTTMVGTVLLTLLYNKIRRWMQREKNAR